MFGFFWEYVYQEILELSGLSLKEQLEIIVSYKQISSETTVTKLRERGYDEAKIQYVLKNEKFTPIKAAGITFTEPVNLKAESFEPYLIMHQAYKMGHLPQAGALLDQPAKIIEIFNLLDTLNFEAEQEAHKEAARKQKQNVK